ncbi:MAG TPA: hypothetical protein VGD01_19300 [Candidatus Elarobacter sp.]
MIAALLCAAATCTAVRADDGARMSPREATALRSDLRAAWSAIQRYHPAPYHKTDRPTFVRAFDALDRRLPSLSRADGILALSRFVTLVGEAHTGLDLGGGPPANFHTFGLKLYPYADGVAVQAAQPALRELAGARLISIDGVAVDEAIRRITPYAHGSNAMGERWLLPFLLARPETLHAAGITREPLAATMRFALTDGTQVERRLAPAERESLKGLNPFRFGAASDWVDARPVGAPVPLSLRHPDRAYWFEVDETSHTLYIQDNLVEDQGDEPLRAFFARAIAAAHERSVERVVLDLRLNGGGNNLLLDPIVTALAADATVNRADRFFVILGRQTQSAAENFVDRLERRTRARFVGEPTGESPNMYGDAMPFRLPGTGLTMHLSSLYWQDSLPYDPRDWTPPEITAELTIAEYAAGRDPALEAILAGPPPALRAALLPAIDRDDPDAIARDAAAWFAAPAHRYADPWFALQNVTAYANGTKKPHAAVALAQLAVRRHPERAFAHDDLGDELAAAGRRDDARAAYRAALARNPHDARAAAALGS